MRHDARPTISFHRAGGGSFTLGAAGSDAPVQSIHGAEGLGVAPVSFSTSPRLAGHGSVLRGERLNERDPFIPVYMEAPTMSELNGVRGDLLRFLSPLDKRELTLRVDVPGRDRWREIPVRYSRGLEGDYGDGYHGTWEKRGIEFKAVDALWRGEPESVPSRQLDGAMKPFLSTTVPFFPVKLAGSTVAGRAVLEVGGDAPTRPVWTITPPGQDLRITHVETGARFGVDGLIAEPIIIDMNRRGPYLASTGERLWARVPLDWGQLFELTPGRNTVEFSMVGSTPESIVHMTYSPRYLAGY
jgi:hypothetical protein